MIAAVECFVPLTYSIHPERSLVVVTRTHTASADEWERFMAQIMSDPAFVRGLNLVDDSRAVTAVPSRAEVERAARWINDHAGELGPARWAIVVAPSALAAFGMVRVAEALTSGSGISLRPFTDLAAAYAWVNRTADRAWD
jgi:hypothetical protein